MQKLKTYLKAIFQSFYNPPLYRAVMTEWQGVGGLYLLVLSGLLAFLLACFMAYGTVQFKQDKLPGILAQMPTMTVKDGILKVQGPEPAKITDDKKTVLVYIDTTKSEQELRSEKEAAYVYVGKDFMLVKGPAGFEKKTFEKVGTLNISREAIEKNWPGPVMLALVVWPFVTLGQLISFLFLALTVAVCSYIVTAPMKEEYPFETRMRMAAIAMTPAVLISKILLLGINHNTGTWMEILLSVFYFYVMVLAARKDRV